MGATITKNVLNNALDYTKRRIKGMIIPGYAKATGLDQETSRLNEQYANNLARQALAQLTKNYHLTANQQALLLPLLTASNGEITPEIETYINEMIAAQQTLDYNSESAVTGRQRAAGYNPDLAASAPGEGTGEIPGYTGAAGGSAIGSGSNMLDSGKARAKEIAGIFMQCAAFGLQTYTTMHTLGGIQLAEGAAAAGADIMNLPGDENGVITDVQGELNNLLSGRTFRSKKERTGYIQEVMRRINALDVATARMNLKSAHDKAKYESTISAAKVTPQYLENAVAIVEKAQEIELLGVKTDSLKKQLFLEYLEKNPEMTEDILMSKLQGANVQKAEAEAEGAEVENRLTAAEAKKTEAEAKSAEAEAERKESDTGIVKLKNEITKADLELEKEIQTEINAYEKEEFDTFGDWHDMTAKRAKYRWNKRIIRNRKHRNERRRVNASIPGIATVGTEM